MRTSRALEPVEDGEGEHRLRQAEGFANPVGLIGVACG